MVAVQDSSLTTSQKRYRHLNCQSHLNQREREVAVSTVDPSLPPTLALSDVYRHSWCQCVDSKIDTLDSFGFPAKSVKTPPAIGNDHRCPQSSVV